MLVDFSMSHRGSFFANLKEIGINPGHMRALFALQLDEPRPMGSLANMLQCDASNVTWMVDGLEDRGLVERRTLPSDRRVKTIVLTPEGVQVKGRLLEALYEPPAELLALDRDSLESLRSALARAIGSTPPWTFEGRAGQIAGRPASAGA